jgi:hypothetical protein
MSKPMDQMSDNDTAGMGILARPRLVLAESWNSTHVRWEQGAGQLGRFEPNHDLRGGREEGGQDSGKSNKGCF